MNIGLNIKKSFRIFLTSLLYTVFFLVLYYFFYILFGLRHPSIALFIMLIFTLFFHDEITWKIRNFIDKNFYRKVFLTNQSLNIFNVKLNSSLDFQKTIDAFIEFLKNTFPGNAWTFFYRWGEDFELFESHGIQESIPKLLQFPKATWLKKKFCEKLDFFPLQKIKQKYPELKRSLQGIPNTDSYYYWFPLRSYKGFLGFLIFDKGFSYYLHFPELKRFIIRIFNKTADVLENDMLYSEVNRKSLQNLLLLEIGKKISSSLDINEVLKKIIDSIKQLMKYNAGGIFLIDESKNELRRMTTRGYDKRILDKLSLKLDLGIYGWVIQNKRASLINDVSKVSNYFEVRKSTRSQLTVPLINDKKVIGVIALESDQINHFTPSDEELLMTFASQAVIAIENAQLYEESLQKDRLESELVVASKVQQALLPKKPPEFPGVQINFLNMPSRIVGGDFYDVFRLGEEKLGIAIGDVSGKGAPASILMAMLYAGFRSLLKEIYPVVEVVARLNNLLTETTAHGYFATFFFGIYNKTTNNFVYTNAGHDPPILIRNNGVVKRLKTGGVVLGFVRDLEYRQETIRMQNGDYLILFTDGVTEVKNGEGDEFGDKRLIDFFQSNYGEPPHKLRTLLFNDLNQFSRDKDLKDDVTLEIIYFE